jgi:hypothetical protein
MIPLPLAVLALATPPAGAEAPASAAAAPRTSYALVAPVPCPVGPEAPAYRSAADALRGAQLDTLGLPPAWAVRAGLYRALGTATDAVCAGRAPSATEVEAARHALGGEAPPPLADALRGLLALAFERAGQPEAAATFWGELRAGERPSDWLVRALIAGADARAAGDLAFSARQQFQRAFELGSAPARCFAAWRLAEEAAKPAGPEQPPEPGERETARNLARTTAAAGQDPVCTWVRAQLSAADARP